jgi:hypothetical protein
MTQAAGGTSWDLRSMLHLPIFLLALLIILLIFLVPIIQLLRRTGHSPLWSLFALFPGLNVIAFWIFAFKPWPSDSKPS